MKVAAIVTAIGLASSSVANAAPRLNDARTYVLSIYRALPRLDFDYHRVRYAPALRNSIRRDDVCAARSGGVCGVEAVPFCDCQDTTGNYAVLGSTVRKRRQTGATVGIVLRNGNIQRFAIDLDGSSGVWRIADVHGPRTSSLLAV